MSARPARSLGMPAMSPGLKRSPFGAAGHRAPFPAAMAAGATGSAAAVGLLSALAPKLALGTTVLALTVVVLYLVIRARTAGSAAERSFTGKIFLIALALRLGVAILTYLTLPYGYFAPDEVRRLISPRVRPLVDMALRHRAAQSTAGVPQGQA